jgi:hypothetical protein
MAVQQAEQQIALQQRIQTGHQQAALAQAAEIAARNPYDPRGDPELDANTQARYANLQQRTRTTDRVFPIRDANQLDQDIRGNRLEVQEALALMGNYIGMGMILGQPVSMAQVEATEQQIQAGNPQPLMDLYDSVLPAIQLYNDWVVSRGVLAPPGDAGPAPLDPRTPPPRQPDAGPAQPQLQMASDADLDQVVREWVQQNNFPADSKIPTQDSGKGEFGGERWRPLNGMERLLADGGMRASALARIKAAIGRYNATIPKKKPGKKPKTPAAPAQPGQAGPAVQAQPNYDSFTIAQANSPDNRGIVAAILRAEEQKGGLLDSQSQTDADRVLTILEQDNQAIYDDVMARENDDRSQARMDSIMPLMAAVNSSKRAAARNDGRPEGDYVGLGMSGGEGFWDNLNQYLAPKPPPTLESLGRDALTGLTKYAGNALWDTGKGLFDMFTGNGRRQYAPQELDFVPGQMTQFNSAMPVRSQGYGRIHRPKFAWEEQEERAGGRYIRQDRVIYNLQGGLGIVNPDNEIGAYQVLRMAGEVGGGMSGGVYLPKEYVVQPAGEKEFFGYGVDGDNDLFGTNGGYGSLKRRLAGGMVNPFAVSRDYHYKNKDQSGYDDQNDFAYGNHEEPVEGAQQAHEEEEEKPVDLDENPNPFRVRNENYKVNTGKMKKVSYKMPNM